MEPTIIPPIEDKVRNDYDGTWKLILDCEFLQPLVKLFFPQVYADIDWSRGYEGMDKELQRIFPRSKVKKHIADVIAQGPLPRSGTNIQI